MSIIIFILLGAAACALSRKLLNSTGVGVTVDVCLGVIGAVIAGLLFKKIGTTDAAGLIMVGIAGAAVPVAAYRAGFGEPHGTETPVGLRADVPAATDQTCPL
jgi:uncharacterized membrane protein YeaQ/YmgE (transglycosylase-associated protein family)